MTTKLYLLILRLIILLWTIRAQIDVVDSFSPGDVSSIAAAVAAAHIGKPPSCNSPTIEFKNGGIGADYLNCRNANHDHRINVIGKAPENVKLHIEKTTATTGKSTPSVLDQSHRYSATCSQMKKESIYVDTSTMAFYECAPSPDISLYDSDETSTFDYQHTSRRTRNECETFFVANESVGNVAFDSKINSYYCNDNASAIEEELPSVQAIFCGYKATLDELSRLRSANIL